MFVREGMDGTYPVLTELVADYDKPVFARFSDGVQRPISSAIDLDEAVQQLRDGMLGCLQPLCCSDIA